MPLSDTQMLQVYKHPQFFIQFNIKKTSNNLRTINGKDQGQNGLQKGIDSIKNIIENVGLSSENKYLKLTALYDDGLNLVKSKL